jgi:hypothetical protein
MRRYLDRAMLSLISRDRSMITAGQANAWFVGDQDINAGPALTYPHPSGSVRLRQTLN